MGVFWGVTEMLLRWIVVIVAKFCEYAKKNHKTELYALKGGITWYVNYISIKLLPKANKQVLTPSVAACRGNSSVVSEHVSLFGRLVLPEPSPRPPATQRPSATAPASQLSINLVPTSISSKQTHLRGIPFTTAAS